jgi:hypothetical protein
MTEWPPRPPGEVLDPGGAVVAALGHDVSGAELAGQLLPRLVAAHGDDLLGAQPPGREDAEHPDGTVADDGDRLAWPCFGGNGTEPAGAQDVCYPRDGQRIGPAARSLSGYPWPNPPAAFTAGPGVAGATQTRGGPDAWPRGLGKSRMNAAGRWPVASGDEDLREFLPGASPAAAWMFWRFIGLAPDCGAVTFELQRSRVVLRGIKRSLPRSGSACAVWPGTSTCPGRSRPAA